MEARLPQRAESLDPLVGVLQSSCFEPAHAALGVPPAGDQSAALEHLEMFRDRGLAHREWPGELGDGRFTLCEARKDGPAGWIGECREGVVEARHVYNLSVI